MTIRKGEDWGTPTVVPEDLQIAQDDAGLFRLLNSGPVPPLIAVLSGDLARTVSASPDRARYRTGSTATAAPLDLIEVTHDGGSHLVASHAVMRKTWLRGTVVVAANAQFIGSWDVAPRSHPNDGFMDITEVDPSMSVGQRLLARRRLPTASHLPHPGIRTSRAREYQWEFPRELDLYLDGVAQGRTRSVRVRLIPDATLVLF